MDQSNSSQHHFWTLLSKKLSKEATEQDLQELNLILLNSPDLHHQADLLAEMWQQQSKSNNAGAEAEYVRHIMKHKDEFLVDEAVDEISRHEYKIEESPKYFTRRKLTLFSFAFLTVAVAGTMFLVTKKATSASVAGQSISSVVTKIGNRTKIVLPDGSQVWLNAGSNLDYSNADFNKDIREVSLNGEAYFDVTKNADKPFIIHTKKMDIKVVGTAFNVRAYNEEKFAEAALIHGSIEVTLKDRKDQKITLKPYEKISVANDDIQQKSEAKQEKAVFTKSNPVRIPQIVVKEIKPNPTNNIIGEIAWTQNKLYFEDESLEDIGLLIERWFGKKVTIANESLKNVHYTGNFENETIEEVLSYLKLSRSFNFRLGNDNVVIY